MTKFPLVRDLMVDRARMFEDLKRVKAWIQLDGTHEIGPGPRQSQDNQETAYPLSRCMTCGCCLEACPRSTTGRPSSGRRRSTRFASSTCTRAAPCTPPSGSRPSWATGGIADCGKAQNCVEVCPKEIPLVDSIAEMGRATTKHLLFSWILK